MLWLLDVAFLYWLTLPRIRPVSELREVALPVGSWSFISLCYEDDIPALELNGQPVTRIEGIEIEVAEDKSLKVHFDAPAGAPRTLLTWLPTQDAPCVVSHSRFGEILPILQSEQPCCFCAYVWKPPVTNGLKFQLPKFSQADELIRLLKMATRK